MDPIACMRECLEWWDDYLQTGDQESKNDLRFSLLAYSTWLLKGGCSDGSLEWKGVTRTLDEWFHLITDKL